MGSKPITQRAGTKYGSAPANQEVTVDAGGTTPAKFGRMSPVKQVKVIGTESVRDEQENVLTGTATENRLKGGAQAIKGGEKVRTKLYKDLDPSIVGAAENYNEETFGTHNPTREGLTNNTIGTGEFEPDQIIQLPDTTEVSFDYKPEIQNIDTEKLRESRQTSRIVKGSGRRATAASNQVDRLNRRLEKIKEKNPGLEKEKLEKLPDYQRVSKKLANKKLAADALQNRFEQNVELVKSGVNPYNTRRSEQSKKATGGEPTKEEFESRFGGGNMGIQEIKSFTPSTINFSAPTIPTSTNTGANFVGSGSYLTQMANDNPKAVGQKRGYKMGGYGAKNK
jgi:hypothetical protein